MPEHHILAYSSLIENVTYIDDSHLIRLLFGAVRYDDIYRANVQEKLKQLVVTAHGNDNTRCFRKCQTKYDGSLETLDKMALEINNDIASGKNIYNN